MSQKYGPNGAELIFSIEILKIRAQLFKANDVVS